ncbi:peptidase S8/S53 domain-containing protein [Jimgerdemannia flammicorona]|uniref:Peptidase S8/S53 domain-containing protein n=1 Tax=Jimgerdemannia flammicorona TaxID=994334 RepID=A0A433DJR5_9FUNG|nr:peptidase S8/S53 domain-containing protein [Jimgerdemannia flammicorona]
MVTEPRLRKMCSHIHSFDFTFSLGIFAGTKYGVAKKANIVYVLDCKGSGTTSGVISGVKWVTNNTVKGKSVINMSLGGGASAALDSAVAAAVTVFVAAGNENQMPAYLKSVQHCRSPARAPSIFTVGSTSSTDAIASSSSKCHVP